MRNLFRFYGIFVFIGLLFLTVSCAGGGSGDGGISYDDDDSATSSSSSAAVFTVTYYSDADGVSAPSVTKASVGGSVTITTTKPVREGYVFIGWATSSGGTVKYQPGSKVVLKVSISLYAVWKEGTPATYTVRHVMPDGTAADTQSGLTGVSGGNTNATANEYPGYHPSGVPNTSIADDGSTVVNISYAANTYTIAFNTNGGTGGSTASAPAAYGSSISLTPNGFTKTGYSFAGWNTKSDGTGTAYSDKASVSNLTSENGVTITLYAMWKPNTYTVKFDANGGTGSMANMGATYDKAMNLPANTFKRKGFAFSGWGSSADASSPAHSNSESVKNLTADNGVTIILYALWTEGAYSITFNANGGSGTMADQTASSASPTPLSSNGFTRTGYTFAGWATTQSATTAAYTNGQSVSALTDDDAVTLYAVWKPNTYTIKFDANGGTGSMGDQSATYDKAAALSANKFSRDGYKFMGWSKTSSATSSDYAGGTSVKNLTADNGATITLYAVWASNTYTISFSANGGTGSMSGQGASLDGSTSLNPNSFSRTGYTFAGWATSASATSPKYTDASSIPALTSELGASVTLYAVWKPNTYTIKFDANGGTGSMGDQSATYDKAAALSANKFRRSGYKFAGWSTNKNASDSQYAGGASVSNLTDDDGVTVTLYAIWEKIGIPDYIKGLSYGSYIVKVEEPLTASLIANIASALKANPKARITLDCSNATGTDIPANAFKDCTTLVGINLPMTITSIGDNAFSGCTGLSEVVIPDSVSLLGRYAFSNCTNLFDITIGCGLSVIPTYAFFRTSIYSITIPSNIVEIWNNAFDECSNLLAVDITSSGWRYYDHYNSKYNHYADVSDARYVAQQLRSARSYGFEPDWSGTWGGGVLYAPGSSF